MTAPAEHLALLLGAAPDRCGWRAGMDADDYREMATWLVEHGVTPPADTTDVLVDGRPRWPLGAAPWIKPQEATP